MAQSKDFPDSFFRVATKGLLMREGKLMMVEDCVARQFGAKENEWELPGGGLDFGETFKEALTREIKEEMGLTLTWMADTPLYTWTVRRENRRNMEWHYVLLMAFPFDVEHLEFTPSEECKSIRFFSAEELSEHKSKISDQLYPLIDVFDPAAFPQR